MRTFEEVLTHFHSFLESATYLDVVPCRWGYVRLFNEGDPINFNAILCRTPQELYTALTNDLETEIQVHSFLESATYLDVVPCRWGYVRLFNEGDPINFNAILCRTPQELYTALTNDLETEIQVSLGID